MTEINSKPFAEQEGTQGNVGKHKPEENKKSYKFKINGGKPYSWPTPIINETDIRRIGQIPDDEDLYLDLPGHWRDAFIERGADIDLCMSLNAPLSLIPIPSSMTSQRSHTRRLLP